MPFEANNTMIYIRNITIRTAKSAPYLGNVGYRFFGWGSMPLGAMAGGLLVSVLEQELGREIALRATFVCAGAACAVLLAYALAKLRLE